MKNDKYAMNLETLRDQLAWKILKEYSAGCCFMDDVNVDRMVERAYMQADAFIAYMERGGPKCPA